MTYDDETFKTDAEIDKAVMDLADEDLVRLSENRSSLTWYRSQAIVVRMAKEILSMRKANHGDHTKQL